MCQNGLYNVLAISFCNIYTYNFFIPNRRCVGFNLNGKPHFQVNALVDYQIKLFLLVFEEVKATINDQVGWWGYMERVIRV